MTGYLLSVDAEFDLDDIWEYIAADNIDAADRWIGQTPGMGHRRDVQKSKPTFAKLALTSPSQ